ncbi:MAG: ferredoxin [Lachnospiraceae bacterium]|nr:ferredoxin [Lachnospiraceae bacterium]
MRYVVQDGCIGCGVCASTCDAVFSIGDDGLAHATDADVPDAARASAAEAKEGCPVGVIQEA